LCHWQRLKKPHLALLKILLIIATIFGLGTLPWQQNFTGLIAGFLTGFCITLALVPYVNLTKYNRKSKVSSSPHIFPLTDEAKFCFCSLQINLIWTCIVSHVIITATMFLVFYLFPTIFAALSDYSDYQNNPNLLNNDYTTMSNAAPGSKFGGFGGGLTGSSSSNSMLSRKLVTREHNFNPYNMMKGTNTNSQPYFDGEALAKDQQGVIDTSLYNMKFPLSNQKNNSNNYYLDPYNDNNNIKNNTKNDISNNNNNNNPLVFNNHLCDTDNLVERENSKNRLSAHAKGDTKTIDNHGKKNDKPSFQAVDKRTLLDNNNLLHSKIGKKKKNQNNHNTNSNSYKKAANDYFFSSNNNA
jgi:hypothetical protein